MAKRVSRTVWQSASTTQSQLNLVLLLVSAADPDALVVSSIFHTNDWLG
jgi:hypothetical protein